MRLVFGGAGRRDNVNPLLSHERDKRRTWFNNGARAMKERMLEDFTLWAVTCPNQQTADDLWDFIRKARETNVNFDN